VSPKKKKKEWGNRNKGRIAEERQFFHQMFWNNQTLTCKKNKPTQR
jgi:hypothetical protein